MEENVRKQIKRVEVFLTRIEGEYPLLTFKILGEEVPFLRGRLRLEGDQVNATEVEVTVPDDSAYMPQSPKVPIVDGKVYVSLVPRVSDAEETSSVVPEDEPQEWEDVPDAEYYDDDELEPRGKASRATIWILSLACLVCVAILVWFFVYGRNAGEEPKAVDTDTVKVDSVKTDTAKADTAKPVEETAVPVAGSYGGNYGSYDYGSYSYGEDSTSAEAPERKRRAPEGNLVEEAEH